MADAVFSIQCSKTCTPGSKTFRVSSRRLKAVSANERAHIDQVIRAAVRVLIALMLSSRS